MKRRVFSLMMSVVVLAASAVLGGPYGSERQSPSLETLHLNDAIRAGKTGEVRALLDQGADVNALFDIDAPPLHVAVRARESQGETIASTAAKRAHIEVVLHYLDEKIFRPDDSDGRGVPIIHHAVISNSPALLKALASAGADLNRREKWQGYTPLLRGIAAGMKDATYCLIDLGADLNASARGGAVSPPEEEGRTPLHLAALIHDVQLVQRLLDRGADPNVRNGAGKTPLGVAKEFRKRRTSFFRWKSEYDGVISLLKNRGGVE